MSDQTIFPRSYLLRACFFSEFAKSSPHVHDDLVSPQALWLRREMNGEEYCERDWDEIYFALASLIGQWQERHGLIEAWETDGRRDTWIGDTAYDTIATYASDSRPDHRKYEVPVRPLIDRQESANPLRAKTSDSVVTATTVLLPICAVFQSRDEARRAAENAWFESSGKLSALGGQTSRVSLEDRRNARWLAASLSTSQSGVARTEGLKVNSVGKAIRDFAREIGLKYDRREPNQ